MTPLGTIPEQSYGELEFPQQQQQQSRSIVKADVHRQQEFAARNASLHAAAAAQGRAKSLAEFFKGTLSFSIVKGIQSNRINKHFDDIFR